MLETDTLKVIEWVDAAPTAAHVRLIDQTRLPSQEVYREVRTVPEMVAAIRELAVRGAPAIGIAAAYGVVLGTRDEATGEPLPTVAAVRGAATAAAEQLAQSRPTAVNLFWALDRMRRLLESDTAAACPDGAALMRLLLDEARAIHDEDREVCAAIGRHGAPLLAEAAGVMTHCNTGALATGGIGTALGVILTAWHNSNNHGNRFRVYACETRPLLQGARLTAWELMRHGIDTATLLTDSSAAHTMQQGHINAVIVGADRITATGDVANKIGTYGLAVLAHHHGIPFYVAAPLSTIDRTLNDGSAIPIEQRHPDEIRRLGTTAIAPPDMPCYAPAFDVTPANLVTALVTERGILKPPYETTIAGAFG